MALAGDRGPAPRYTAANSPYVHYQRDADASTFVYSQSSYGNYGAAPRGWYCGVPVLGINEEVFGNVHGGAGQGGVCYSSQDQLGATLRKVTGVPQIQAGPPGSDPCNSNDVHGDFDFFDPTFSGPPGELAWEQMTGKHGTLVERWTGQTYSPGGVLIGAATSFPYYRDDSCFDDGTGTDPGPKINLRSKDEPRNWWVDPASHRPVSNSTPPAGVRLFPRRCWNHHADGTPYNIPGTQSFDPARPAEKSDPTPNPGFSPQGDVRYFQGDIGTHGLHVMLIADSDNAQQTVPVDELDSEQVQVILPGRQPNVGEAYGRSFEKPMTATAAPAQGLTVENLAAPR